MPPPSSAYSVENFEICPDEELVCSVCRCVFNDPVECPCRHVFCRSCITNWLERKYNCPVCRKNVMRFDLLPVVPIITNMIAKLRLNCPNMELGCLDKISLEGYDSHLKVCRYELVECKYSKCKQKFIRASIEAHEKKECKYRLVCCRRECQLMVSFYKLRDHDCVTELKKLSAARKREIKNLKKQNAELQEKCKNLERQLSELQNQSDHSPTDSIYNTDSGNTNFSLDSLSELSPSLSDHSVSSISLLASPALSFGLPYSDDFSEDDGDSSHDNDDNDTDHDDDHGTDNHDENSNDENSRQHFSDFMSLLFGSPNNTNTQSPGSEMNNTLLFRVITESNNTSNRNHDAPQPHVLFSEPRRLEQLSNENQERIGRNNMSAMGDSVEPGPSGLHNSSISGGNANSPQDDHNRKADTSHENSGSSSQDSSEPKLHHKRKRLTPVISDSSDTDEPQTVNHEDRKPNKLPLRTSKLVYAGNGKNFLSVSSQNQRDAHHRNLNVNLDPGPSERTSTTDREREDLGSASSDGNQQVNTSRRVKRRRRFGNQSDTIDSTNTLPVPVSSRSTRYRAPSLASSEQNLSSNNSSRGSTNSLECEFAFESNRYLNRLETHTDDDNTESVLSNPNTTPHEVIDVRGRTRQRRQRYANMHEVSCHFSEPTLSRTVVLLNRYATESDPDWEPSLESLRESDKTTNNAHSSDSSRSDGNLDYEDGVESDSSWTSTELDSESSYEVEVPERTLDLLMRYSEEPSEDDEDWEPSMSP